MKAKSAIAFLFLSLIMGLPVRRGGQAVTSSSENVPEAMPKDLEVRLALSALPPYLRSEATVYVLDPAKGYAAQQKGTNDFTCFVERTDWVRADFRNDLFIRSASTRRAQGRLCRYLSMSPGFGAKENSLPSN